MTYQSKADMVTAKLREMIIGGELRAGAPLRQRDLATLLGVSQTPVREALRRLESEGLAHSDPHRGTTVAEARMGLWNENYAIRAALESLAAQLACDTITDDGLSELADLDTRMREHGRIDDEYHDLNKQFHMRICEIAEAPMLLSLITLLWRALGDGPHVVRTHTESTAQHGQILAALGDRDKDAVGELIRTHILQAPITQA